MTVETARLEELLSNPLWRLENLYWIVDDDGNAVKFRLREVQRDYLNALWSRNLIVKSRQQGFSTLICVMTLDECLFRRNITAVTVCHKLADAQKMFRNKVLYPWGRMPQEITSRIAVKKEASDEIVWDNGSGYSISTSARSGTAQILHVSEFGSICAHDPIKAAEIITGSLPAVPKSGKIHIESTAEGAEGKFYEMVMTAKQAEAAGRHITVMDYKLQFFPWWKKVSNTLDPEGVIISKKLLKYFETLKKKHGIDLSPSQMAWYVKERDQQGDFITREHPSFLVEAFEAAIKGAILQEEMAYLRESGAIGKFPYDPRFEVNTFWDFGVTRTSGQTVVIYHQRIDGRNRIIDCDFGTDIGIGGWVNAIRSKPYTYGRHYMPHDVRTKQQGILVQNRQEMFNDKGIFNITTVPRIDDLWTGVQMLKSFLITCQFNEDTTSDLIKALDLYRREWDEKGARYKDRPLHNASSDFADALRQAAQGYEPNVEHYTHQHGAYQPVPDEILEPEVGY